METGFDRLEKLDLTEVLSGILPKGESIISVDQIPYGHVNRNLRITTKDTRYFCKIAPLWYKGSLDREAWALGKVKDAGCLVPSVLGYLDKDNDVIPEFEMLLLEHVDGDLLEGMNERERGRYYSQIVKLYNLIHSIPVNHFGWLNKEFEGSDDTWMDFLVQIENEDAISSLDTELLERVSFVRRELAACLEGDTSSSQEGAGTGNLLYGDFNYANFIVNRDDRVVALDFQNCFSGDPLYDVAMMLVNDERFEAYLKTPKGYDLIDNDATRRLVYLYCLRYLTSMLIFFMTQNNKEMIIFARKRFSKIRRSYAKIG